MEGTIQLCIEDEDIFIEVVGTAHLIINCFSEGFVFPGVIQSSFCAGGREVLEKDYFEVGRVVIFYGLVDEFEEVLV